MSRQRKKTEAQLSLWAKLPQWAWQQGLRSGVDWARNPDSRTGFHTRETTPPTVQKDIKQAETITSRIEYPQITGSHRPVLDIDFPCAVVPSTTPGHFHLYLDHEMEWDKYEKLLHALADAGIIEDGYRWASIARRYTAVRLPWVKKPAQEAPAEPEPTEAPAAAPAPAQAQWGSMDITGWDDDQPEVEEVDRVAQQTPAPASTLSWLGANADPLGDVIEAADRIRNQRQNLVPNPAYQQSFGTVPAGPYFDGEAHLQRTRPTAMPGDPLTVTYEAMTMRYRDNRGRTLTGQQVERAAAILGLQPHLRRNADLVGIWERLLSHQRVDDERVQRELDRIAAERERRNRAVGPPRMQGLGRDDLVIIDEVPSSAPAETLAAPPEPIIDSVPTSTPDTSVESIMTEAENRSQRRARNWGGITPALQNIFSSINAEYAARTHARLEEERAADQAIRDRVEREVQDPSGTPLVVTYTRDGI